MMKKIQILIFLLVSILTSIMAQSTEGKDFWLTFGQNANVGSPTNQVNLQVRIASGSNPTTVTFYFINLATSQSFEVDAFQVFDYTLSPLEKASVYNTFLETKGSLRINSSYPITVYALSQVVSGSNTWSDVTNVFPSKALGSNYFNLSYTPAIDADAYAVIAMEDNTNVYHNSSPVATLNTGNVYYRRSPWSDMTGSHITSTKPIAFYAFSQRAQIPQGYNVASPLVQQLAPVDTWGKNFFVPASHLIKDRIRIVASQNNTNITQKGGELKSVIGSQLSLTGLLAGQFLELEINLDSAGCYIQSDKPIGVCTYLTSANYNNQGVAAPAQCWVPAMEQALSEVLVVPFKYVSNPTLNVHYALVVTPTKTKENTEVSIGNQPPTALSGGIWIDNNSAGMSYYPMPLTNDIESYRFINGEGLFVLCYGVGNQDSYYYLGGSSLRDLEAAFYANNISYQFLSDTTFCNNNVNFLAEIEGFIQSRDTLRWYINDGTGEIEEIVAQNQLKWSKIFPNGVYKIRMEIIVENEEPKYRIGTLKVQKLWIKIRNVQY